MQPHKQNNKNGLGKKPLAFTFPIENPETVSANFSVNPVIDTKGMSTFPRTARLVKSPLFYRYGKRLVVVHPRQNQDFDVIAYSNLTKSFVREPKLYALIQFDNDGLVQELTETQFEAELAARNISPSQWQVLLG
jgi:hypothetical protein